MKLVGARGAAAHNPQIQREEANSTNQQNKCFHWLCFVVVDLFAAPEEEKRSNLTPQQQSSIQSQIE